MTNTAPTSAVTSDPSRSPAASRRWWNHEQARWEDAPTQPDAGPAPVDVRDMLVVHTALLREFRLAPAAVARVPVGARARAAAVAKHLGLLCDLLHHHHAGEDELLWPPLRERLPVQALARLDRAEAQHDGIESALRDVGDARRAWIEQVDTGTRDGLAESLRHLHTLLADHLDVEERDLLPLAVAHLSAAEWQAIGEAGAAGIAKSKLPLVFGMFAYEGDPVVLAAMLAHAPAVPRRVVPLIAPRIYARHARRIHGTSRP